MATTRTAFLYSLSLSLSLSLWDTRESEVMNYGNSSLDTAHLISFLLYSIAVVTAWVQQCLMAADAKSNTVKLV
jgi:hypothetical protein